MKGCTVYSSQNQECSRLRKWEGESIFKVLTVTRSYVQIYPRNSLVLPQLFLLILLLSESYLLLEEMPIFLQNTSLSWRLAAHVACKNDPQWKPAELQKDSSELSLQSKLSLICRECFPCFLLVLKTGLGLLQNAVFFVTCIRFHSSGQAQPLARRVSAGLCVKYKGRGNFFGT